MFLGTIKAFCRDPLSFPADSFVYCTQHVSLGKANKAGAFVYFTQHVSIGKANKAGALSLRKCCGILLVLYEEICSNGGIAVVLLVFNRLNSCLVIYHSTSPGFAFLLMFCFCWACWKHFGTIFVGPGLEIFLKFLFVTFFLVS